MIQIRERVHVAAKADIPKLTWRDRLKVLFGAPLHVRCNIRIGPIEGSLGVGNGTIGVCVADGLHYWPKTRSQGNTAPIRVWSLATPVAGHDEVLSAVDEAHRDCGGLRKDYQ